LLRSITSGIRALFGKEHVSQELDEELKRLPGDGRRRKDEAGISDRDYLASRDQDQAFEKVASFTKGTTANLTGPAAGGHNRRQTIKQVFDQRSSPASAEAMNLEPPRD